METKKSEKLIDTVKKVKQDRKGVELANNGWIANKFMKGEVDCKPGDEVEVLYTINGQYKNLQDLRVIKSASPGSDNRTAERKNVDSGNILQRTIELLNASTDLKFAEKRALIKPLAEELTQTFQAIWSELDAPTEKEKSEINAEGEYE